MNEHIKHELENVIERAVEQVGASRSRKRLMREELLAHVLSAFEQEFDRLGNEQMALEMTLERFGAAEPLGNELQATLSVWNRWIFNFEKEIHMSRWLWMAAVLSILIGPGFIFPAIAQMEQAGTMPIPRLIVGILITLAGLVLIGNGIRMRQSRAA